MWRVGHTTRARLPFGMLRVVEAIKRELGLPNEIEGAVSIITAANAVMGDGHRA